MTKPIQIGTIHINTPEVDEGITKMLERLTNMHESGELKSMLVVFSTHDAVGANILGDKMHHPFLTLIAARLAEGVEEAIIDNLFSPPNREKDD